MESFRSSQDDNNKSEEEEEEEEEEDEEEELSQTNQFQFIDLSKRSKGEQTKNLALVRSHVTKVVRRTARLKRQPKTQEQGLTNIEIEQFLRNSSWSSISTQISQSPALNSTFSAFHTYKGKITPYLHQLFEFFGNTYVTLYSPKPGEPNILSLDWFSSVQSNPALFHASCYTGATLLDLTRSSLFYSVAPEIRRHKAEAIHLINKELEKGIEKVGEIPEAVILAIMMMLREASEQMESNTAAVQPEAEVSPFKPPFIFMQWQNNYSSVRSDPIHVAGYKAIVRTKGGIENLQQRHIAACVSYNGLLEASFEILKPPEIGFYALPEAMNRIRDPNTNIPLHPRAHQGSGLVNLLKFGVSQEALAVMMDMLDITVLAENHLQGTLRNPDLFAIATMRDLVHHKLLSLPRASGIYECCRLSAIVFATAALFPMPRSTGVPQRLVNEIKKCVDQISLVELVSEGARSFFVWVLMLAGIAADGLPAWRQWAEETLAALLTVEGVSKWSEVKRIVESFLWMDFACNDGAIKLWETVAEAMHGR